MREGEKEETMYEKEKNKERTRIGTRRECRFDSPML